MKAFVEHLCGVVRVGPDCDRYGKPFEYAVAFSSVDGKTAVLKALVSSGDLEAAHVKAALRAIKNIGLSATWERIE